MTITWDDGLEFREGEPVLRNLAASGGRSPTGREQRVLWDAGYWHVPISGIRIHEAREAAAYRAMIARLRQGEDIIFNVCQLYLAPGARDPGSSAVIPLAQPLRATRILISPSGIAIAPGYYFSIGDRLHLITEIIASDIQDPDGGPWLDVPVSPWGADQTPWDEPGRPAGAWIVSIVPPLRAALAPGTVANFRDLRLRCVLQDLGDGDLSLDLGRFGTPSLTLIESI